MFDPNTFLNTTVEDASATKAIPIPTNAEVGDGDGYPAVIMPIEPRSFRDNSHNTPDTVWMDVWFEIHDPRVTEKTKRDSNRARFSVRIEQTPSGGIALGEGVNVNLGRLREAVGQNEKGKPWGPLMLTGQAARVYIKHRYNEETGEGPYAEVERVVPAS